MVHKLYSEMSTPDKIFHMGRIVIAAQSEELFGEFNELLLTAQRLGVFDRATPGDPGHEQIKDVDTPPIENGIKP